MVPETHTPDNTEQDFAIRVRAAKESDLAYIASSWLKAYGASLVRRIGPERYFAIHRPVVAALMARSAVYVAHPEGDPDTILGTLVVELPGNPVVPPAVHWLYVRNAWRGNGIARAMLEYAGLNPAAPLLFTCWTSDAASLVRKFPGIAHVPAALLKV